ncbi:SigE family RNA polymerase sigma factor [Kitasatospora sp. HPMI-4]|uniref:SigE family RNA polymerase sigma factor n=1 Tax=Kitasatospora sp. HPMI-4 TaxID=3448443 RepID=UPI003F1CDB3E
MRSGTERGRTVRGSDDAGFSEYVAARWGALVQTAYLLTGDFHEAEDLVQVTLAKAFPHWRRIREETVTSYLRRALVNNNRSRVRRRRVTHLLMPFLPDRPTASAATCPGEDRDLLVVALAGLPERQRAVVVLRYWEDLSVEEVAHELGCSVGTVKSQSSRALAKLRADPALIGHAAELLGVTA